MQKKTNNDISEIQTETYVMINDLFLCFKFHAIYRNVKDSISSSISFQQEQSGKPESILYKIMYFMDLLIDAVTTDVSDLERRVRNYRDQLKAKRTELDKLKQKKTKEELRKQEDELKKQLQVWKTPKITSIIKSACTSIV